MSLTPTQISACCSFAGSFCVLLSLAVCDQWRNRLRSGKLLMGVISFFDFVTAANYVFNVPSTRMECLIQATTIQIFEVGSWNYNAMLGIEIAFIVVSLNSLHKHDPGMWQRHAIYHAIVLGYALISTTLMLSLGLWGELTLWCWVSAPALRVVFAYIPLWLGYAAIFYSTRRIMIKLSEAREAGNNRSMTDASAGATPGCSSDSTRGRRRGCLPTGGVLRLWLLPILFVIIHLPGTSRRILEAANDTGSPEYHALSALQAVCDPSHGTITFLVWLLLDADLREEWLQKLRIFPASRARFRSSSGANSTPGAASALQKPSEEPALDFSRDAYGPRESDATDAPRHTSGPVLQGSSANSAPRLAGHSSGRLAPVGRPTGDTGGFEPQRVSSWNLRESLQMTTMHAEDV